MTTATDRTGAGLRGLAAGSISGAVAAHNWSVATVSPTVMSVGLLVASSVGVGTVVAMLPAQRLGRFGLFAVLVVGQVLGHLVIGAQSGHARTHGVPSSGTSVLVHLCAAIALTVVICGVEAAYRLASAALSRVLPLRYHPAAIPEVLRPFTVHRDRAILRVFGVASLYGRAPPRHAHI